MDLLAAASARHSALDRFAILPGRLQQLHRHDSIQLELTINQLLCNKLAERGIVTEQATFVDLFNATGVECTIVALNVTVGQPAIFNHYWTPSASVAAAVVASSAIPVAFSPALGVQDIRYMPPHGALAHVLVDGGAWANYPQFVFRDRSFRRFHNMPDLPSGAEIIGFVLVPAPRLANVFDVDEQPLAGWLRRRTVRPQGVINGSLAKALGTTLLAKRRLTMWGRLRARQSERLMFMRHGIAPLLPLWLLGVAALLMLDVRDRGDGVEIGLDFGPVAAILLVLAAVWPTIAVLGRAMQAVASEGVATAKSLLGAATGVPVWAGLVADDMVVFVPDGGLATTEFTADPDYVPKVVAAARESSATQLSHYLRTGRSIASGEYETFRKEWARTIGAGTASTGSFPADPDAPS
jgi:predicted acylesterase/phospholipase RssA